MKFKDILNAINPITWFEKPIKRKVIGVVVGMVNGWVEKKVSYQPLEDYILAILKRLEDVAPQVISNEDRADVFLKYWESHKGDIITEQARMLKSIADAEVKDKELVEIIKRTIHDLNEWNKNKI